MHLRENVVFKIFKIPNLKYENASTLKLTLILEQVFLMPNIHVFEFGGHWHRYFLRYTPFLVQQNTFYVLLSHIRSFCTQIRNLRQDIKEQ